MHHPAILHLYIHALEMSNTPQLGMRAADVLAPMCPDSGHLSHMPGHIYVLCGDYEKARLASVSGHPRQRHVPRLRGAFHLLHGGLLP